MPTHRVHMYFFESGDGWVYQFLEPDLKTSIGRIRILATEQALRALIERTPTVFTESEMAELDRAFSVGRGGVWLDLTGEQYAGLQRRHARTSSASA